MEYITTLPARKLTTFFYVIIDNIFAASFDTSPKNHNKTFLLISVNYFLVQLKDLFY